MQIITAATPSPRPRPRSDSIKAKEEFFGLNAKAEAKDYHPCSEGIVPDYFKFKVKICTF